MLERNQIYLGDCYELIKQIPDKSIDLIVIDPPYQIDGKPRSKEALNKVENKITKSIYQLNNELMDNNITQGIKEEIFDEFMRIMKVPNIYIWCNKKQIPMYLNYFVNTHNLNFEVLVWNKPNVMPLYNRQYLNDVEYCLYFRGAGVCNPNNYEDARTVFKNKVNKVDKFAFHHPTCKPVTIIETLIKNSSKENDLVLDCFLGSGTTAVACKNLKRDYIGIEINPKWYKVAKNRLDGCDANGQQSFILR
ncbi:MAG: DNA methyltransferase [Clostridia bacterium]|nr:DNA methyltransferase [Clostridia bacterium]